MNRKKCLSASALGLLLSLNSPALAEQIVELDLDGVPGNGPDTAYVSGGSAVPVDVWFRGGDTFIGLQVDICNPDDGLAFESVEYSTVVVGPTTRPISPQPIARESWR
ncbi:MAG: hypothetical protein ABIK65_12495 [Candidatus Eisenbacteria bacterium]